MRRGIFTNVFNIAQIAKAKVMMTKVKAQRKVKSIGQNKPNTKGGQNGRYS